ncbi:MAG: hypothetical protein ACFFG0_20795 [Candidatus Thorarchaeota archaeon]
MVRKNKKLKFQYKIVYSERFTDDLSDSINEIEDLIRNRFKRDRSINAFLFENDMENPLTPDWKFIREYFAIPIPAREKAFTLMKRDTKKAEVRVR